LSGKTKSIDFLEHRHDIFGGDLGKDIVNLLENETAAGRKLLKPLPNTLPNLFRRTGRQDGTRIATSLALPPSHVYGVATFYAHFTLVPKGKHECKLCDGTACHVRGSEHILHALQKELKLSDTKHTTDDMLFTVETVSCLGACGLAPVLVIDDKVHGNVSPEQAVALIQEVKANVAE
jgi:NADH-quinone oxidoreductase subunit E